jgi:hypothetical protein
MRPRDNPLGCGQMQAAKHDSRSASGLAYLRRRGMCIGVV